MGERHLHLVTEVDETITYDSDRLILAVFVLVFVFVTLMFIKHWRS